MPAFTSSIIEQSGVIPFRIREGQIEIALVTASSGPHWTIPKGHVEDDLSPVDSAAKEAYEESGLIGRVDRSLVGSYTYEKRGKARRVVVFAMKVDRELPRWPEMLVRRRKWMSPEEAASRVKSAELRCCIQDFKKSVKKALKRGQPASRALAA